MRGLRVCAAAVTLALLAACTGTSAPARGTASRTAGAATGTGATAGAPTAADGSVDAGAPGAHLTAGGWTVRLEGTGPAGGRLSLSPTLTPAERAAVPASLAVLHAALGTEAGTPVQVHLSGGPLPAGGATMTRTLPSPLPAGRQATLASFDPAHAAWVPVATTLSADRQTLTAHLTHFSIYIDLSFLTKTRNFVEGVLDTRVAAPTCHGRPPAWVRSTTFLDDRTSPLRWCAGTDPNSPNVLVVKAAVNRSYGMSLAPLAQPAWMWDSMLQGGPDDFFIQLAAKGLALPSGDLSGKLLVAGGAQANFGFTEAQVRSAGGVPLLRASADPTTALAGVTYTALTGVLGDGQGPAAAIVTLEAVAQCGTTISRALAGNDWVAAATAAVTCLLANAETITTTAAGILARQLKSVDPKVVGKLVGKVGGKLWQVWAAGMLFQAAMWATDAKLADAARTFNVFTTTVAAARTRLVSVRPVNDSGQLAPGYTVRDTAATVSDGYSAGGCVPASEASPEAYRCFGTNHFIYDPCWAEGSPARSVLCLDTPWSRTPARLTLSGPLDPLRSTGAGGDPWGLHLADGSNCSALQGTHDQVDGRVVDYYCGDGGTVVLRGLDRSGQLWRAQTATHPTPGGRYTMGPEVGVVTAWYAQP